jgi:hypothetical protein
LAVLPRRQGGLFCPFGWPLIRSFLHVEQGNDHFGDVSKMVVRINTLIVFLMSGT